MVNYLTEFEAFIEFAPCNFLCIYIIYNINTKRKKQSG